MKQVNLRLLSIINIIVIALVLFSTIFPYADEYIESGNFGTLDDNYTVSYKVYQLNDDSYRVKLDNFDVEVIRDTKEEALYAARERYKDDYEIEYIRANNQELYEKLKESGYDVRDMINDDDLERFNSYLAMGGEMFGNAVFPLFLSVLIADVLIGLKLLKGTHSQNAKQAVMSLAWTLGGLHILVMVLINPAGRLFILTQLYKLQTLADPVYISSGQGLMYNYTMFFRSILIGLVAIAVMSGVLAFIVLFIRLGRTAGNPTKRAEVLEQMWLAGKVLIFIGGIPLIGLFMMTGF